MTSKLKTNIFLIYLSTFYSILNPGGQKVNLKGNRTIHREIANQAMQVRFIIATKECEFSLN